MKSGMHFISISIAVVCLDLLVVYINIIVVGPNTVIGPRNLNIFRMSITLLLS